MPLIPLFKTSLTPLKNPSLFSSILTRASNFPEEVFSWYSNSLISWESLFIDLLISESWFTKNSFLSSVLVNSSFLASSWEWIKSFSSLLTNNFLLVSSNSFLKFSTSSWLDFNFFSLFSISLEASCFSSSKSLTFLFLFSIKSDFWVLIVSKLSILFSNSLFAAAISTMFLEISSFLFFNSVTSSTFFSILLSKCKTYSSFINLSFFTLSNLSEVTAFSFSFSEIIFLNSLFLESIKSFSFFTSSFSKSIVFNLSKVLLSFSCNSKHSVWYFSFISSFSERVFSFCASSVI